MTITDFLLARIAEDEALAGAVEADNFSQGPIGTGDDPWPSERAFAEHLTPARVLAECEAKRRIVERALGPVAHAGQDIERRAVLIDLASVYADHPDFDPAWALD